MLSIQVPVRRTLHIFPPSYPHSERYSAAHFHTLIGFIRSKDNVCRLEFHQTDCCKLGIASMI